MKSLSTLGGGGPGKAERGCWRSQNSMADSSTTAAPILNLSLGRPWAGCQPLDGIRYVTVASILMEIAPLLTVVFRNPNSHAILNSMPDPSTTSQPIFNPLPGRHWARRQLHAGIRDVALASTLIKSLHSPGGGSWEG